VGEPLATVWIKKREKKNLGVLFTFWWLVWKERNRIVFDQESKSPQQLLSLILEELRLFQSAYSFGS
jgi:hypothetical protein